jgi:hypothetical protein
MSEVHINKRVAISALALKAGIKHLHDNGFNGADEFNIRSTTYRVYFVDFLRETIQSSDMPPEAIPVLEGMISELVH